MDQPVATPAPQAALRPVAPRTWIPFALVCLAYMGVTIGEQALSPVMPEVNAEFGVTEGQTGVAFGLLAASIAAANLVGGAVLGKFGPKRMMLAGLAATTAGAVFAALTQGFGGLVAAQVLLGIGAGLYFPAGLQAIPVVSDPKRRGFYMGIYGVAFSGGLTVAALLGAIGAASGWRLAFWVTAALAGAAFVATLAIDLGQPGRTPVSIRFPLRVLTGMPIFVGGLATICQYGALPFLTTFATAQWGLSAGQAATLLLIGRLISIVAKLTAGAGMDRNGPLVSARRTGLLLTALALGWTLLPAGWITYGCAALFAGAVSSLGPIANILAVDHFGSHGPSLGAFRSLQIGIGAVAGWLVGHFGELIGLRTTLVVASLVPVLLVIVLHRAPLLPVRARGSAPAP